MGVDRILDWQKFFPVFLRGLLAVAGGGQLFEFFPGRAQTGVAIPGENAMMLGLEIPSRFRGTRMSHAVGRYLPLSPARRFVGDLVHFAKQVPTVPMQRRMSLADVVAARKAAPNRPSWCSIFAKAFAL